MRVFISSTVYDLLDVRAEVEQSLRDMHLVPVLSGSSTSEFQTLPDQNSIQTCLANVRASDALVIILCQRYGPSLKSAGFDDLSATHLEYNEARTAGKPIYMYVRDRLEADYSTHKSNAHEDLKLSWVRDQRDWALFDLLSDHRKLAHNKPGSNWIHVFRDSLELKTLIARDFRKTALRRELETLIVSNNIPALTVVLEFDVNDFFKSNIPVVTYITNLGNAPAYQIRVRLEHSPDDEYTMPMLAPRQECPYSFALRGQGKPWEYRLEVTYYMAQGHRVTDTFRIGAKMMSSATIKSGATFLSKQFHVATANTTPFTVVDQ